MRGGAWECEEHSPHGSPRGKTDAARAEGHEGIVPRWERVMRSERVVTSHHVWVSTESTLREMSPQTANHHQE